MSIHLETNQCQALDPFSVSMRSGRRPSIAPTKSHRMNSFDAFRSLAAFSTVLVHCSISRQMLAIAPLSRFSLPFFVVSAIYFLFRSAMRDNQRPLVDVFRSRARRLLVPFFAWNAIYAGLSVVKHFFLFHDEPDLPWKSIWVGSAHQLWFLPFLLIVTSAVLLVIQAARSCPIMRIPTAMVLAALGVVMCYLPMPAAFVHPLGSYYLLERMFRMLPSVCWGISLGLVLMGRDLDFERDPRTRVIGLTLVALGIGVLWMATVNSGPYRMARHLSGIGVLLIAIPPDGGWITMRLAKLGRYSYGIFLSHLVFVEGFLAVASRRGIGMSWELDVSIFVLSCVGATGLTILLMRFNGTRWLVG